MTALAEAAVDVLRFWLTVMAPPVTLMGPAISAAVLRVIAAVLELLPMVKPVSVLASE
jgi:hypothetical protein